uniref:EF-hand domain-containing protein n=1 Tax=Panagrolaimus sp. JU765 TaxID=591449 RepID=A0AC34QMB1_9BILA
MIRRWWDRTAAQIDARNQEKWRKEYSALGGASEGLTLDKMDQVAVQKAIVPDAAFRTLVKQFDVDGNGKIDEREFMDFQSRWFAVPGNVTFSWLRPGQN